MFHSFFVRFQEARGALLPVPNRVDGSLAEQVKAMQEAAPKDDDLAAAQTKVPKCPAMEHFTNNIKPQSQRR